MNAWKFRLLASVDMTRAAQTLLNLYALASQAGANDRAKPPKGNAQDRHGAPPCDARGFLVMIEKKPYPGLPGAAMRHTAVLLISCPDQKGLVAAIADFLLQHNANILHADQHQDAELKLFLMRVEWDLADFSLDLAEFAAAFEPIARRFGMAWRLAESSRKPRLAVFVSKFDHCLADLLYRYQSGELHCELPIILSNHEDTRWLADAYHIPYQYLTVHKDAKREAEHMQLAILRDQKIDFIVLARYMQVLSADFIRHFPNRIINIHHSFLPAFHGAKPYHRAFERGVKLIGATAHYVTETLDDGPIIEQDVARISHRDSLEDLINKGADLEKVVLSRAVKWHLDNRVLVYANKTVVFD
jgi:formyltetrahydrofolate deformylase